MKLALGFAVAVALVSTTTVLPTLAQSENLKGAALVRALEKKPDAPLTRTLGPAPKPTSLTRSLANDLDDKFTRSMAAVPLEEEVKEVVAVLETVDLPTVDFTIEFEYNSSRLTRDAQYTLQDLGKALNSKELRDYKFLIAGHTDAVGTDAYNIELSNERAWAVQEYLIDYAEVPADMLDRYGFGESMLKNKAYPEAAENRRVTVINLAVAQ